MENNKPFSQNNKNEKPLSFIKLGMVGIFDNKKYQAIGRVSYKSNYKEWDNEDHKYTNEIWFYDEWLFVSEDKEYLYICEDKDVYEIGKKFIPKNPKIPQDCTNTMNLEGDSFFGHRILEYGKTSILFFEGENTWAPEVGDVAYFAMYRNKGMSLSAEWTKNEETGQTEEVSFYKEDEISKLELLKKFLGYPEVDREIARIEKEFKIRSEYKRWAIICTIFCLLILIIPAVVNKSRVVFNKNYSVSAIDKKEEFVTDLFTMSEKDRVYGISLLSGFPDNSSLGVAIELINENNEVINAFESDFWKESGVDSEGSWSESFTSNSLYFKLKNPGNYYMRILVDPDNKSQGGSLKVLVEENVILFRYYLIADLICLFFVLNFYFHIKSDKRIFKNN